MDKVLKASDYQKKVIYENRILMFCLAVQVECIVTLQILLDAVVDVTCSYTFILYRSVTPVVAVWF
jgi:hypothetical protein